jgi:hypothetical protein
MRPLASPKPFLNAALAAFPRDCRSVALAAAHELLPIIDDAYRKRSIPMNIGGQDVYIPVRLHFSCAAEVLKNHNDVTLAARCLLTRSTDGYLRQRALISIIKSQENWVIPFVILLASDYVAEIVSEILLVLPELNRLAYADFVLRNRPAIRVLRAKATSYWNAYYRRAYPSPSSYPALAVLHQLETWAS